MLGRCRVYPPQHRALGQARANPANVVLASAHDTVVTQWLSTIAHGPAGS
ncbi:hypothetical protein [Streptomyces sp. IMTB 2501]|nr:hypothetical protein [Streptomyces sp. IMTB 2501]